MSLHNLVLWRFLCFLLITDLVACALTSISRSGWTATADSFQSGNEAGKAIDGSAATFWHSKYTPAPTDALPNWIMVDMKSAYNIQAITVQPRPDGNANGRIGGHRVEVSTDSTNWQVVAVGTYNNDATTKRTAFVPIPARYIRITATSEAQSPSNQWTSISEIQAFHDPAAVYTQPSTDKGLWQKTVDFPLIPAAVSLLPNGKVLVWSAYAKNDFGGSRGFTQTGIFDPITGESSQLNVTNTQHDMFCPRGKACYKLLPQNKNKTRTNRAVTLLGPGISSFFDGRVIITGGSDAARVTIYDPARDAWTSAPNMKIARGYQSTTTCSDGRVFAIGGSWSGGRGGKNGEIYDPSTNTWTLLANTLVSPMLTADAGGIWRSDNHAWLFGWKNRTVFQAGPSIAMNWYDMVGTGRTTAAGDRLDDGHAMNGNAVMYDALAGKILTAGGAPDYENSDARSNAYVITIGAPNTKPTVIKTKNMAYARGFANAVVLPDGTVFVTGGQARVKPFQDATAAMVPELWDPTTGLWAQMNPMAIPRTYHSVAILLADGTVFNGGGGLCGQCTQYGGTPESNHFDAEIFVPPYLLNSDGSRRSRPEITAVVSTIQLGKDLNITTSSAVTKFSLIRTGTATHTVNTDQRRIPLSFVGSGTSYKVTIPGDPGVVIPGYWLLFAIDANGTPSVGKIIKLTL